MKQSTKRRGGQSKSKRKAPAKRSPVRAKKSLKSHPRPSLPEIDLSNLEASKNAMAEVLRRFSQGRLKDARARTLGYLYSVYLGYLRLESEARVEKKLDQINARLQEVMKCT